MQETIEELEVQDEIKSEEKVKVEKLPESKKPRKESIRNVDSDEEKETMEEKKNKIVPGPQLPASFMKQRAIIKQKEKKESKKEQKKQKESGKKSKF